MRATYLISMVVAGLAASTSVSFAGSIDVQVNQAKIVKLSRPADTIIIGNPDIADASVQDASTLVLTGKGFGSTNLVVLDETGAPIVDEQISVTRGDANIVRMYRRANLQALSCTPLCESAYLSAAESASDRAAAGN